MPLINARVGGGVRAFYTVQQIRQLVQMGITNIKFGVHPPTGPQGVTESIKTSANSGARPIDESLRVTHSIGLITCSSVIYVCGNNYYVHHANTGDENLADFESAMDALGNPTPATVSVIYGHLNESDQGFQRSVNKIISFGIPAAQIFEIENLDFSSFGINNRGQIGY